ncbi:hypothetical protein [Chitinophaga sancti]|uniref:Uncharacterized protein n=1 Tax=Chitinophaga sancti TaxID=1004 RepID=A0A1K1M274_9BACT|nr:hypothetical protein [Chitinophaga sancti]WQD64686.1 hypothetical protein U0033_09790 [Chitinophaga sancti]WQG89692.1 hypothetical protein SR876_32685 [Chitinophaga sancti]SFW17252.1 hypothetical protein SAMN05661012_00389 [Chitinophaga sancti]
MNRKRSKPIHVEQHGKGIKKAQEEQYANPFAEMFWKVNGIPVDAREMICKQCDWSVPTFYRKLRVATRPPGKDNSRVRGVSSAELTSIKAIYVQVFEDMLAKLKAINLKDSK